MFCFQVFYANRFDYQNGFYVNTVILREVNKYFNEQVNKYSSLIYLVVGLFNFHVLCVSNQPYCPVIKCDERKQTGKSKGLFKLVVWPLILFAQTQYLTMNHFIHSLNEFTVSGGQEKGK